MSAAGEKRALRKAVDEALLRARAQDIADWSGAIARRVMTLDEYKSANDVFAFSSMAREVQTARLIEHMLKSGKRVYLPVTRGMGRMDAVRVTDMNGLVPGRYGILEPARGEVIDPAALDLILIPGAAFDRACGRLGRGGGFYDRYLASTRAAVIALAFEAQLVGSVPREVHDRAVDMIVTERAVYQFKGDTP